MDWFRKSELSSDRFSLLVTGDLETVQSVILRLAGGASSEKDELSTMSSGCRPRSSVRPSRRVSGAPSRTRSSTTPPRWCCRMRWTHTLGQRSGLSRSRTGRSATVRF